MSNLVNISDAEHRLAERVNPSVAGSLAVSSQAGGLAFTNAGEAMEFAKLMALSHVAVPKHLRGNPGACLAIVIQAVEWRMSPYAVANKSYSVNDRLAYESQLIQAVILQRAPIKGRFKVTYDGTGDKRTCTVAATLTDGGTVEYTSPPTGSISPKHSPLWKTDPDQQLFYYSGRALCRRHFPDVLLGVYAMDEIERDPEIARDVTPTRPRTLQGRFDALAPTPDHDAETGEITEPGADAPDEAPANGPAVSPQGAEGAAPRQGQQAAGAKGSPPAPAPAATDATQGLRAKLEPKARKGVDAYRRAKSDISDAEAALLTDALDDELLDIAEAADKAREVPAASDAGDDFPGDR